VKPFVLDASVLLAVVRGEKGHERVLRLRQAGYVSTVNMAEARSRLADYGMQAAAIEQSLSHLKLVVVDFSDAHAKAVAALRSATRAAGLSLGDRACLALAAALGATAMTADRTWSAVALPVPVDFIR
jgi:PIN domain nuclease of toxin-antitoxin system